jgi:hypothetical protein
VVINCVVGLQVNGLIVAIDCHFVVLQSVVTCTKVTVVGWDLRVEFYGILDVLDFLCIVAHLSDGLAFQVPKLTLLIKVKTDVAAADDVLPTLESHEGVSLYQVGLLVILESIRQLEDSLVVLLLLEFPDLIDYLFGSVLVDWLAVVP